MVCPPVPLLVDFRPRCLRRFGILWLVILLSLVARRADAAASAKLTVNLGTGGTINNASTNTGHSFKLHNESNGGEKIVSFKIDLRTALLPDVVFDPAGTAGDPDGKDFANDFFDGSGTPVHSFESPHNGINSGDGYDVLRIDFASPVSFGPGKRMEFSADIDPTNVKGVAGPGPEHSASICGMELIGATVTVIFDDATVRVVRMGGLSSSNDRLKTSLGVLASNNLPTPGLSVPGKSSPFVATTIPTVRVTGPAGAAVEVWVFDSALHLAGVPNGGYDIDPFETNKVEALDIMDATIGGGGFVDVPLEQDLREGIHQVAALLTGTGGLRSSSSDILTFDYDPDGGVPDNEPPTTPGNLIEQGVTAGSVTFGWDASSDNTGVAGYRVSRNGAEIGTTTQLVFTDNGRQPSTLYHYGVKAYDAAGNESPPALLDATTGPDMQDPTVPGSLQGIGGDELVLLSWTASTDDAAVAGYRIRRGGVLVGTVTALNFTDTNLTNGTPYQYEVRAYDTADKESAPATVSVTPVEGGATGTAVLRVDVGSDNPFVDPQGNTWVADFGYNSGNRITNSNPILGTDNPQLYQSRRSVSSSQSTPLAYALDLANGNYQVVLHFIEVSGSFTVGSRVFDIVAEGTLKVDNMDILSRVPVNTACMVDFPVIVADGTLDLSFPKVASNPTLSGIEVFEIAPDPGPPTFEEWLAAHGLAGQTAVDSDHGGLDNWSEFELQLDPNDSSDDWDFKLDCSVAGDTATIHFPTLRPLGNYSLHRTLDLEDIGNVAKRIDTVTRAEIEAMTMQQREEYSVNEATGAAPAFYQLFFEPAEE